MAMVANTSSYKARTLDDMGYLWFGAEDEPNPIPDEYRTRYPQLPSLPSPSYTSPAGGNTPSPTSTNPSGHSGHEHASQESMSPQTTHANAIANIISRYEPVHTINDDRFGVGWYSGKLLPEPVLTIGLPDDDSHSQIFKAHGEQILARCHEILRRHNQSHLPVTLCGRIRLDRDPDEILPTPTVLVQAPVAASAIELIVPLCELGAYIHVECNLAWVNVEMVDFNSQVLTPNRVPSFLANARAHGYEYRCRAVSFEGNDYSDSHGHGSAQMAPTTNQTGAPEHQQAVLNSIAPAQPVIENAPQIPELSPNSSQSLNNSAEHSPWSWTLGKSSLDSFTESEHGSMIKVEPTNDHESVDAGVRLPQVEVLVKDEPAAPFSRPVLLQQTAGEKPKKKRMRGCRGGKKHKKKKDTMNRQGQGQGQGQIQKARPQQQQQPGQQWNAQRGARRGQETQ
ncbi:hypothetical protein BJX70DRAFT_397182 [Aspergillus crustosus]